jgi:hypothetical protein
MVFALVAAACFSQTAIHLRLNPEIGATYHYACEFQVRWNEPDGTKRADRWLTRLKLSSKRKGQMTMFAQALAVNDSARRGFLGTGTNDIGPVDFPAGVDGLFHAGPVVITEGASPIYNFLALAVVAPPCGFVQSSIVPGERWDFQREGFFGAIPRKRSVLTLRSTYLGLQDRNGIYTAEISTVLTKSPTFHLNSSFLVESGICYLSRLEASGLTGTAHLILIQHPDGTRTSFSA